MKDVHKTQNNKIHYKIDTGTIRNKKMLSDIPKLYFNFFLEA